MKITSRQVEEKIGNHVSKSKGIFTVRKGYFYRNGYTSEMLEEKVRKAFPEAIILATGDKWKPFRGGASLANQSHWYVKFELPGV
jgi:hypothetical protein